MHRLTFIHYKRLIAVLETIDIFKTDNLGKMFCKIKKAAEMSKNVRTSNSILKLLLQVKY